MTDTSNTEAENGIPVEAAVKEVSTEGPGEVPVQAGQTRRHPEALLDTAQDVGFVVVAAHFLGKHLVAKYSQSICQVVEGSETATALQARLGEPVSGPASAPPAGTSPTSGGLVALREPVQAVDGSGAWFKCLLQHSQAIACPGTDAPIHLNTLLMQEFRPESTWPVQNLLELLRKTCPIVVLPHAAPPDVVRLIMNCGSAACLVAKNADAAGNADCLAEAAMCVTQLIEDVRSGMSLNAAMLRSDAAKHFDLVMP